MKNTNVLKKLFIPMLFVSGFLLLAPPASGQDASKELKIKIVKEKNGERTVIDTTLSLSALEELENNEELKKLLKEQGLDGLNIDIEGLEDVSVDIEELDMGGKERIMVIRKNLGEADDEETLDVMLFKSDSTAGVNKMRVMADGSSYEYLISHDDTDLTWIGDDKIDVEVIEEDDGRKVIVKKEDGSVEEYELPDENGTYMIGEDGEVTKVEEDVVWVDEGSGEKRILVTVDDEDGTMVITESDQIIELQNLGDDKNTFIYSGEGSVHKDVIVEVREDDGGVRKVRIEQTIIVERIDDQDLEILEKAGADMDMKGKEKLEIDRMKFHPNPSNGQFTLEFETPETGMTNVEIFDVNGKKVYEDTVRNFNGTYKKDIDISGEQSGTYFLKIQQGEKLSTRKIILE